LSDLLRCVLIAAPSATAAALVGSGSSEHAR